MKPLATSGFTAYVGIDWADTKHDVCLQVAGNESREFDCIAHRVTAILQAIGDPAQLDAMPVDRFIGLFTL